MVIDTSKITSRLANRKHLALSGAVVALCELAKLWFPQYAEQLKATQGWAMSYGLLFDSMFAGSTDKPPAESTDPTGQHASDNITKKV